MADEYTEILEMTNAAVDKIAELMASRKAGPMAVRVMIHPGPNGSVQSEIQVRQSRRPHG